MPTRTKTGGTRASTRRAPKVQTNLGRVLAELRARYDFHNQDLAGRLTPSDLQQLSRMSSSAHSVVATAPERRRRLAEQTAAAVYAELTERWNAEGPPHGAVERLRDRLVAAMEQDVRNAEVQPLKGIIADKLASLTGLSVPDLAFLLEDPTTTLERLCATGGRAHETLDRRPSREGTG